MKPEQTIIQLLKSHTQTRKAIPVAINGIKADIHILDFDKIEALGKTGGVLSFYFEEEKGNTAEISFTDDQLKVIGKAIEAFLKEDTVITDEDGQVRDEMTISLCNNAQGIRYYLGLEETKPDYITNSKN